MGHSLSDRERSQGLGQANEAASLYSDGGEGNLIVGVGVCNSTRRFKSGFLIALIRTRGLGNRWCAVLGTWE